MPTAQAEAATLDLTWVRSQFPSLAQTVNGQPAVFFDGPGGTQVPQRVIDAIANYLRTRTPTPAAPTPPAAAPTPLSTEARAAMADFLGCDKDEVVFGPNMTTLTFAMSRAIGRELGPGDEILLTHLDHDANVSPWRALEERGVTIRFAEINEDDCTLDLADLAQKINSRTRVVAVGYASNAVGTINDVKKIVRLAHQKGAPRLHRRGALRAARADRRPRSGLRFPGLLHLQVFWAAHGRSLWQTRAPAAPAALQSSRQHQRDSQLLGVGHAEPRMHRRNRGVRGVSRRPGPSRRLCQPATRRAALLAAYRAIQQHEARLAETMIRGLLEIPGLKLYGITDPAKLDHRCPTFAVRIAGHTPLQLATRLGDRGFFTWDGNYYALNLTERLDVEKDGGFLRIGLAHYNTAEEVTRLLEALREIAK